MRASDADVQKAIRDLTKEKGYPPTIREVGGRLGYRSTSSIFERLEEMRRTGKIGWERNQARTLRVVKQNNAERKDR